MGSLSNEVKKLSDLLSTHGMVNLVDFITRPRSSTCLDHVYSNIITGTVSTAPVITNLSDHIGIRSEVIRAKVQTKSYTLIRRFSQMNKINFIGSIDSIDWKEIFTRNNINSNDIVKSIINIIRNKFDICFPLRKTYNTKNRSDAPWITAEVKNYKSLLFDIINISKSDPDNLEIQTLLNDMNNYYDNLIYFNRNNYYENFLKTSNNTCRSMWSLINKERGIDNCPLLDFTDVVVGIDGSKFKTKKDVVNAMNSRFLDAAGACGAPHSDLPAVCQALSARCDTDRSLRLRHFTDEEVYLIVTKRIPPKLSKDVYGISMKVLHSVIPSLAPILAHAFNCCIREGKYPDELKISKVSPLFKGKGKRSNIDGYRPVSIIPAIAKVLENGLSSRLTEFLTETNAMSDRQYAYREGRSTTSLTREVIRYVVAARERKQHVAVICCDLSKAFDVADHNTLSIKLRRYGIGGPAHKLLTNMLQNRTQVVRGGGITSDPIESTMGVAQGSSVSNILFSILLNDLPDAVTMAEVYMYADDVAAIVDAPSIDQLETNLNHAMAQLAGWFRINGLALNLTKTNFLHFCLSGRNVRPISVTVDGTSLQQVHSILFLGFLIDRGLQWSDHIHKLCARIGSACYAMRRLANMVSKDVVRACYFATVHSLLQYGTELWSRAADWERVFRMQKRAVRTIVRIRSDVSVRPHFGELNILTLPGIAVYQVATYVRSKLESYVTNGHRHMYSTRNRHKLESVSRTLEKSARLTHIMGATVYNKLPTSITEVTSDTLFKARLKRFLIKHSFYSYNEFIEYSVK